MSHVSTALQLMAQALGSLGAAAQEALAVVPERTGLPLLALPLAALAVYLLVAWLTAERIPELDVPMTQLEAAVSLPPPTKEERFQFRGRMPTNIIPCFDPSTLRTLGEVEVTSPKEVAAKVAKARVAQEEWQRSSFGQRRKFLKILLRYILDHQDDICRVSARDSGKPMVDANFGEVLVTCEKITWLLNEGERWLQPEARSKSGMMFYKKARVEYVPVGVMGAIVSWNYPFHNVFNPLLANIFAGNALVVKVGEYTAWSGSGYYARIIEKALAAAGAPADLVQIVPGYAETAKALINEVDKLVFVGSSPVGKLVMKQAAETLTPVVLELGGKDPFIVLQDAELAQVVPTAMRGAFQSSGQNCAGAERFFIHKSICDEFTKQVLAVTKTLRQGPPLDSVIDCGAMCMPNAAKSVQALIDDAVAKGAKVLIGGHLSDKEGQFYPPTIIIGITSDMKIAQEEVFGPVMAISTFETEDELVQMVNNCPYALGSNIFSGNQGKLRELSKRIQAGMAALNDFACTYMCQSLPFGGVKDSGFDRFAGIEGLRGCCHPKAVVEDAYPWLMKTYIPPPLQYPMGKNSFSFVKGLVRLFYEPGLLGRVKAVFGILTSMQK